MCTINIHITRLHDRTLILPLHYFGLDTVAAFNTVQLPVSYTHLDVYKRQITHALGIQADRQLSLQPNFNGCY